MADCDHRAVLIVTISAAGTSTNVVRRRLELRCTLPDGHAGQHSDVREGETWDGTPGKVTTLLRDENE